MSTEEVIEVREVDGRIGPTRLVTGKRYRLVVHRSEVHRIAGLGLQCTMGSGLVMPSDEHENGEEALHPIGALMVALDLLEEDPRRQLVVVGHAVPGETEPDRLSLDRAQGIVALVRGERAAWVDLATSSGHLGEVKRFINYLGRQRRWSCFAGPPTPDDDEAARAGVEAFQREYNSRFEQSILEDGICGVQTLGAVFDVLRFELDRWKDKHELTGETFRLHATAPALGAGVQAANSDRFPAPKDEHGQPRIELFVFVPKALGSSPPTVDALYFDASVRIVEHDVPSEPGAWEFGEVVVFLPEQDPGRPDHRFQLRSASGDYDRVLSAQSDGEVVEGFVELVFDMVPIDGAYTLLVHSGAETTVLYADVPYADIERPDPVGDEELLDPHFIYGDLDELVASRP